MPNELPVISHVSFEDKILLYNFLKYGQLCKCWRICETGTCTGLSTKVLSQYATVVYTIECIPEYYKKACEYLKNCYNVIPYFGNSPDFLNFLIEEGSDGWGFFLDAHFWDPNPLPAELAVIGQKNLSKIMIIIHDFYVDEGKDIENGHFGFDQYLGKEISLKTLKYHVKQYFGEVNYHLCHPKESDFNTGHIVIWRNDEKN